MKTKNTHSNSLLTDSLSEPLNGTTTAKLEINSDSGNLTIDRLTSGEPILASGTLEYSEKQDPPTRELRSAGGHATLTLKGKDSGRPWFRFPWAACNGATEWLIHLNPTVSFDINAQSGGGNLRLDLAGMVVNRVSADSGGGNLDVILPGSAGDLKVEARTGAGNINIHLPDGIEARIQATSGLGKVIVDSRFNKIDNATYQTPGYDSAPKKVCITAKTGAGNVSIHT